VHEKSCLRGQPIHNFLMSIGEHTWINGYCNGPHNLAIIILRLQHILGIRKLCAHLKIALQSQDHLAEVHSLENKGAILRLHNLNICLPANETLSTRTESEW